MGRNRKVGLDYFPMDVDFFQDIRIRKLIKYQGGKAVTVYALLLCIIYKQGYYMRWDEELPFIISEQTGFEEAYIQEVFKCCLVVGLFSKELYDSDKVITSKGIQERYKSICDQLRRVCQFDEFGLISSEEISISSEKKGISSEEKGISSAEMPINSAKSTQKKGNKKKDITPTPPIQGEPPENKRAPRKKKEPKSIHSKARIIFEEYFSEVFGESYYWSAKDAGSMKQILRKIEFNRSQKQPPLPNDEKEVLNALVMLLQSITDGWLYEHFSVTNINSQFNEIVSQAKKKAHGKTDRRADKEAKAKRIVEKYIALDIGSCEDKDTSEIPEL